jgi:hypothetical protein
MMARKLNIGWREEAGRQTASEERKKQTKH